MKKRKIPLRQCVGCQVNKPKKELIRIVRSPEGEVFIDPTGKKSGRGAYICADEECIRKALKEKRLERALQHPIAKEVVQLLEEQLK